MTEILNLEKAKNALIKKALLKYKTNKEVAEALGCSEKHIVNKLKEFKHETNRYEKHSHITNRQTK